MTIVLNLSDEPVVEGTPGQFDAKENLFVAQSTASIHSVIGAATGLIQEHITNKFPRNYFKHIHVENSLASVVENYSEEEEESLAYSFLISFSFISISTSLISITFSYKHILFWTISEGI